MDAITLLTDDHRNADQVFDRFQQSADPDERGRLVNTMIEELSIHAAIEERELYPVMRRSLEQDESVDHAKREHAQAKAILALLGHLRPGDERFDELSEELISDVRHHVEEEEQDLLPRLREALSDDELEQLGQRLAQAKQSAPTRPSSEELEPLTVEELQELAQKIDLDGRSQMNKSELVEALVG